MSQAVTKGAHWLKRSAQYSMHGQRNGRVDVLPPDAELQTFHDLRKRYDAQKRRVEGLREQYIAMRDEIAEYPWVKSKFKTKLWAATPDMPSWLARKLDAFHALKDEMNGANAHLEDYKQAFNEAHNFTYERMWIATAHLMLPWNTVGAINRAVAANWQVVQSSEPGGEK